MPPLVTAAPCHRYIPPTSPGQHQTSRVLDLQYLHASSSLHLQHASTAPELYATMPPCVARNLRDNNDLEDEQPITHWHRDLSYAIRIIEKWKLIYLDPTDGRERLSIPRTWKRKFSKWHTTD